MKKLAEGMLGEGERLYPRLIGGETKEIDDIAALIERRTTFTRGELAGILAEFADIVAETVAGGDAVRIEGLGTFRALLGLVDREERGAWTDSADRLTTGRNVRLKTVNFRPDKRLLYHVERDMKLERIGGIEENRKPATTIEERADMARKYLSRHPFMRVADYAALIGRSTYVASKELRRLAAEETSGITSRGTGTGKVYIRRTADTATPDAPL